ARAFVAAAAAARGGEVMPATPPAVAVVDGPARARTAAGAPPHDVDGAVGRAVVADDHLEVLVRLGQHGLDGLGDEALAVVRRDQDTDDGGHPASLSARRTYS